MDGVDISSDLEEFKGMILCIFICIYVIVYIYIVFYCIWNYRCWMFVLYDNSYFIIFIVIGKLV